MNLDANVLRTFKEKDFRFLVTGLEIECYPQITEEKYAYKQIMINQEILKLLLTDYEWYLKHEKGLDEEQKSQLFMIRKYLRPMRETGITMEVETIT